jgi:hypothetical protein
MLVEDGAVGPRSDITSKGGFFATLFEYNGELKRFLQRTTRGIREKNLHTMDTV